MAHASKTSKSENSSNFRVRSIHPSVGAEISDVDLKVVAEDEAARIRCLLDRYSALLFRNQHLSESDLVRVSRFFGDLDEAPVNENGKTAVEGYPEIYVISNIAGSDGKAMGSLGAGEAAWHTDMSYLECPPHASLLYAVEIPPSGGNTWLAGMYAVLDSMPHDLRCQIERRRIKHDGTYNSGGFVRQGLEANNDPLTCAGKFHPAICKHPGTGREVLFLGRRRNAYVEGLSLEVSEALLDKLWAHATHSRFTYSHQWRVGDLLMWDNRATLHRRDAFDLKTRRYMLRTQIKGKVRPEANVIRAA